MKNHRFVSHAKGGPKGRKGQTKMIRVGSRTPGATNAKSGKRRGQGSIRNPF